MPNRPTSVLQHHAWLRALFVGVCAIAIAVLAAHASWRLIVAMAGERLAAASLALLAQAEDLDNEAARTLRHFDSQPAKFCSSGELAELRHWVYATHYVKDIARMRGTSACAASVQAAVPAFGALDPARSIMIDDARRVSPSEAMPLLSTSAQAPVIAGHETRIALDPAAFRAARSGHAVAYLSRDGTRLALLYGEAMPLALTAWRASRLVEHDGVLLAPQCSRTAPVCVAMRESKSSLLDAQWPLLVVSSALGAMAGGGAAFVLLLLRSRRRSIDARLRRAIDRKMLEVEYQPIMRLGDGSVVGAEALVRWHERKGPCVQPARFIPLAEELGCIGDITRLVLHATIRDFGERLRGAGTFYVNINFSAQDLNDARLHADMARMLGDAGIACSRIGVEITEHSTTDREMAIAGTQRLSDAGHAVCIDDFGTGYSSLASLAELHVNVLKLDRSFTAGIDSDGVKRTLVPRIVELARTLGMKVVVEGVETASQADYLRSLGGDLLVQGWLYGQSLGAQAFHSRWPADR